jgi:parvulin-like peptidyl-prolyl isomerase
LIGLAIIIIPAFVFWGSGSLVRDKKEKASLGKLYGRDVSSTEYKDALEAVKNIAVLRFGDNLNEVKKYLDFQAQAWERIILLREAKKRKITISDSEVIGLIESMGFFKRNGRFDNKAYLSELQYVFRTPARIFEEQVRQNIMIQKLYKQVTDGITIGPGELKEEYRRANEQVSVSYLGAIPAEFEKAITPKDAELKEYFTKNAVEFKEPPSYNIEYLTSESQDKIKEAFLRLSKKSDFGAVAKELGLSAKETGLFNQTEAVPGLGWSQEITDIISRMKVGELSPAFRMEKNNYILRLKEKKEPYIPDFVKVRDRVKDSFIKKQARQNARQAIKACLEKLKIHLDFNKAAKECGLKTGSTELFKYGSYIEGIGASDLLWTKAGKLKDNEASDVIDIPSGFYIIKVKQRVPYDEKKFTAELEDFNKKMLEEKKQEYFTSFVAGLIKKAAL